MHSDFSQNEQPLLSVLITCFNEEKFIVDTLGNVTGALSDAGITHEVLVIDDCSSDGSVQRVKEYILEHPRLPISLKANTLNRGLGQNYVDGAFLTTGKYYRLVCGDNAESRDMLRNIFQHTGMADVIIPYQIQSQVVGKTAFRRILSRVFTGLVNVISGYRLRYYNGLQIHLRYNVMRYHASSYGFGFQADMLTSVLDQGASYIEIPSTSTDKKGSASSALSLRNVLSVIHSLLEILARRIRNELYGKPRNDLSTPLFRAGESREAAPG